MDKDPAPVLSDDDITIPPRPGTTPVCPLPRHSFGNSLIDPKATAFTTAALALHAVQIASIFLPVLRIPLMATGFGKACGLDPLDHLKDHRQRQTAKVMRFVRETYPPHYIRAYKEIPVEKLDDPAKIRLSLLPDDLLRDPGALPVSHRAEALKTQILSGLQAMGWTEKRLKASFNAAARSESGNGFTFFMYDDSALHTEHGLSLLWQERGILDRLTKGEIEEDGGLLDRVKKKARDNAPGWLFTSIRKGGEHIVNRFGAKLPAAVQSGANQAFPVLDVLIDARTLLLELSNKGAPTSEQDFIERLLKPLADSRHHAEMAAWRLRGERGLKPERQDPDIRLKITHSPMTGSAETAHTAPTLPSKSVGATLRPSLIPA